MSKELPVSRFEFDRAAMIELWDSESRGEKLTVDSICERTAVRIDRDRAEGLYFA